MGHCAAARVWWMEGPLPPIIQQCWAGGGVVFRECAAGDDDGSVYAWESGLQLSDGIEIVSSVAGGEGGAAFFVSRSTALLEQNVSIARCHAESWGGAVYLFESPSPTAPARPTQDA